MARKFLDKSSLSINLSGYFYQCADIDEFDGALQRATDLVLRPGNGGRQEGLKAFLEKRKPVWKNR